MAKIVKFILVYFPTHTERPYLGCSVMERTPAWNQRNWDQDPALPFSNHVTLGNLPNLLSVSQFVHWERDNKILSKFLVRKNEDKMHHYINIIWKWVQWLLLWVFGSRDHRRLYSQFRKVRFLRWLCAQDTLVWIMWSSPHFPSETRNAPLLHCILPFLLQPQGPSAFFL